MMGRSVKNLTAVFVAAFLSFALPLSPLLQAAEGGGEDRIAFLQISGMS